MINNFTSFFHIAIITIIFMFLGCGYKAPPVWEINQTKETNNTNLHVIDINSTLKVKIGVK